MLGIALISNFCIQFLKECGIFLRAVSNLSFGIVFVISAFQNEHPFILPTNLRIII